VSAARIDAPSPLPSATLEAVRAGDAAALVLVRRCVRRSAAPLANAGGAADWEDVAQDVLIAMLVRDPMRARPRSLAAYLHAAARHACIDALRRERGRRRTRGSASGAQEVSGWRLCVPLERAGSVPAPAPAAQRLLEEGLLQALARLGEPERRAIAAKYLLGLSDEEAAHELGMCFAGYRRLVARGVAALRKGVAGAG
jgi:RNA polymerase sigma factor (sigma-70 family)